MNEQITELLLNLATELGTTTELLWSVLLRQAAVSSAANLTSQLLIAGLLILALRKIKKINFKEIDRLTPEMPAIFVWVLWLLAVFAWVIVFCGNLHMTIAGFLNPEYWALKEVLNSL